MAKGPKGFTLVELLVVLLIMSLLLVAVPFTFDRTRAGLEVRSNARDIAGILREARGIAIRENQDTTVLVDVSERLVALDGNKAKVDISEGVTITFDTAASEQISSSAGRIRFFPSGASTGGRVTLDRRGNTYRVEVDWLYGRVRILE